MDSSTRAIILLQYLQNNDSFAFTSPVLTFLEQEKRQNDVIFSLDNLSDSLNIHFAKKLMDESSEILLICDLKEATRLAAMQTILNYAIKRKQVMLVSLGENPLLKPFITACGGEIVENVEGLKGFI